MNERPPLVVNYDGSVSKKGRATYWWVVRHNGKLIASGNGVACAGANAVIAEWAALGFALRWVLDNRPTWAALRPRGIVLLGDCRPMVEQLNGVAKCRDQRLAALRSRVDTMLAMIGLVWVANWVRRKANREADLLCRKINAKLAPMRRRRKAG